MGDCEHKRYKKNYPFGKKSHPTIKCKICNKPIKPKYFEEKRKEREYQRRRYENSIMR